MNIDLLCKTQREVYGEWFIAKPEIEPFWMRLKSAFKVLSGEGVCVTFTENVDICNIVKDRIKDLLQSYKQLQKIIQNNDSNIISVAEMKLSRELLKLSVSFVGSELKIKNYDISINKQNQLILTDGSKVLDSLLESDIMRFYEETKFKFLYDKILITFKDIEKNIEYMKTKENDVTE